MLSEGDVSAHTLIWYIHFIYCLCSTTSLCIRHPRTKLRHVSGEIQLKVCSEYQHVLFAFKRDSELFYNSDKLLDFPVTLQNNRRYSDDQFCSGLNIWLHRQFGYTVYGWQEDWHLTTDSEHFLLVQLNIHSTEALDRNPGKNKPQVGGWDLQWRRWPSPACLLSVGPLFPCFPHSSIFSTVFPMEDQLCWSYYELNKWTGNGETEKN